MSLETTPVYGTTPFSPDSITEIPPEPPNTLVASILSAAVRALENWLRNSNPIPISASNSTVNIPSVEATAAVATAALPANDQKK